MFGGCPYYLNKTPDKVCNKKVRSCSPTNQKIGMQYVYIINNLVLFKKKKKQQKDCKKQIVTTSNYNNMDNAKKL